MDARRCWRAGLRMDSTSEPALRAGRRRLAPSLDMPPKNARGGIHTHTTVNWPQICTIQLCTTSTGRSPTPSSRGTPTRCGKIFTCHSRSPYVICAPNPPTQRRRREDAAGRAFAAPTAGAACAKAHPCYKH